MSLAAASHRCGRFHSPSAVHEKVLGQLGEVLHESDFARSVEDFLSMCRRAGATLRCRLASRQARAMLFTKATFEAAMHGLCLLNFDHWLESAFASGMSGGVAEGATIGFGELGRKALGALRIFGLEEE